MRLRKGMTLQFSNREETIIKASNNQWTGNVVTEKETYSTDFIYRWLHLGFVTIKENSLKEKTETHEV